jgi:hypothetical protein
VQRLTTQGQQIIEDMAQRYGVSTNAVMTLLQTLIDGRGTMAQFNHPELGGSGQWMRGGMTMIGDMFNYALKSKVDGLCSELAQLLAQQPAMLSPMTSQSQRQEKQAIEGHEVSLFVPAGSASANWWPTALGAPSTTGAQNQIRYAYFPAARRLAVDIDGHITVYDTLDHQISGVSQQQGPDASLIFTSQLGLVRLANLPVVSIDSLPQAETKVAISEEIIQPASAEKAAEEDIISKIERLAELRQKGILTEAEFAKKKAELLSRL